MIGLIVVKLAAAVAIGFTLMLGGSVLHELATKRTVTVSDGTHLNRRDTAALLLFVAAVVLVSGKELLS